MTERPLFLEPGPDGTFPVVASAVVGGIEYHSRLLVERMAWADPEVREYVVADLKRALADEVLSHVAVTVRTWE
jgi:hypothetical protein